MAKLKKANHISLVENVTQQIEEAIVDGEYKTGDKLPSTGELQTLWKLFDSGKKSFRQSVSEMKKWSRE